MPTKNNKKASGSSRNTSETHKFSAKVQNPHAQDSNAKFRNDATAGSNHKPLLYAAKSAEGARDKKRKATDSEEVEEDSENEVVDSPEVKRMKST